VDCFESSLSEFTVRSPPNGLPLAVSVSGNTRTKHHYVRSQRSLLRLRFSGAFLFMPAIALKHFLRRTAGYVEIVEQKLRASKNKPQACIFYYHRVSDLPFRDRWRDDRNVTPGQLERHIAALAKSCEVVPLTEVKSRLGSYSTATRPIVGLTFDDGYANFRHSVLPILERYGVPATLS